jgi:hypothetical protein
VLLGSGCGRDVMLGRNLKEKVEESQVAGTWMLAKQTIQFFKRDGLQVDTNLNYEIEFKPDGKCSFQPPFPYQGLKGEGSWKLEHDGTAYGKTTSGSTKITQIKNMIRINFSDNSVFGLGFAKENGELILWNSYGSPDNLEFIEYRKH